MASPPFSISTVTPGDSDIVSQFPLNERSARDIIQSWILANHNTNGDHTIANFPWAAEPSAPATSITSVYATATGKLKAKFNDTTTIFLGLPPGAVIYTASSTTPTGYLVADGSAVSRTTFADLFNEISTTHGAGNGTTTFNIPDIKGRVIAGEDAAGSRLSSTYFGATASLAAVSTGLSDHITLLTAMLPPYTPTGHINNVVPGQWSQSGAGGAPFPTSSSSPFGYTTIVVNSTFVGDAQGGSNTPFSIVQPTIILRALIKI